MEGLGRSRIVVSGAGRAAGCRGIGRSRGRSGGIGFGQVEVRPGEQEEGLGQEEEGRSGQEQEEG